MVRSDGAQDLEALPVEKKGAASELPVPLAVAIDVRRRQVTRALVVHEDEGAFLQQEKHAAPHPAPGGVLGAEALPVAVQHRAAAEAERGVLARGRGGQRQVQVGVRDGQVDEAKAADWRGIVAGRRML